MSALVVLVIGVIATALMTIFMNTCAALSKRNLRTVRILTVMFATLSPRYSNGSRGFYRTTAIGIHYGIGVLFVLAYFTLRGTQGYIGHLDSTEAWIIGAVYGTVGVSGWLIFVRLHPLPPSDVPWTLYLLCIFVGHLVFTFSMIWLVNISGQMQFYP